MAISHYREFVLVVDEVEKDEHGVQGFTVQVFSSPAGEGQPEPRTVPAGLRQYLEQLEERELAFEGIVGLGEALADLLLPAGSRQLFVRSLDRLGPEEGLRVRLRLPPVLASIPWEYMYVQRGSAQYEGKRSGSGEKDATGFLALDPRVSIVRHESLPVPADFDVTPRTRRLLVALSDPADIHYWPLDLGKERANMEQSLAGVPGITLDFVEPATVQALNDALVRGGGADVFHFAGHGLFEPTGTGTSFRSTVGEGSVVFVDDAERPVHVPADQFAVNLRGHGVQLVVLGACETGRRDGENVWSGVVAALMEAEIPAAVAMQYRVWDDAAVAFGQRFYQALAVGLPLDQAVSAGRLAVFNRCHPLRDDPQWGRYWRDWGVPVLYVRSDEDFVLPAVVAEDRRQAVAEGITAVVDHRFGEIGPRGKYVGVEAGVMRSGRIEAHLEIGRMAGQATQVEVDEATGGEIHATGEADVLDGEWTGVKLGSVGGPAGRSRSGRGRRAGASFCTQCSAESPEGAKFCPQCGAKVEGS